MRDNNIAKYPSSSELHTSLSVRGDSDPLLVSNSYTTGSFSGTGGTGIGTGFIEKNPLALLAPSVKETFCYKIVKKITKNMLKRFVKKKLSQKSFVKKICQQFL